MQKHKLNSELIILGAGKPISGSYPSSLKEVYRKARVLDWILETFKTTVSAVNMVIGYHSKEILEAYKNIDYVYNPDWDKTGSLASLFYAITNLELAAKSYYVCYSDVLFRKEIIDKIESSNHDIVIAVDSNWKERYKRTDDSLTRAEKIRTNKQGIHFISNEPAIAGDVEFAGLVKFSKKVVKNIIELKNELGGKKTKSHLPVLLNKIIKDKSFSLKLIDAAGNWTELDDPKDLAKFILGSKSNTLRRLKRHLISAKILDQISVNYHDWKQDDKSCLRLIKAKFKHKALIIRSDSDSEDGFHTSNAGAFLSVLDVPNVESELLEAIEKVFSSYTDLKDSSNILIQPMLRNVKCSGVVFSRTLNYGAPYFSINYVRSSDTAAITSGISNDDINTIVSRNIDPRVLTDGSIEKMLHTTVLELESLIGLDSLDVEFAINKKNELYILQVRPIAVDHNSNNFADTDIFEHINYAKNKCKQMQKAKLFLHGDTTYFGVMPDWNPAEIIGTTSNRLASSLYQHIITDEIWAQSRMEFGYKDIRSKELMTFFCGRPYIDIRASLNSFLPLQLSVNVSEKLVNYALSHLKANPWLHDKIEFEVIPTCYSIDFKKWEKRLKKAKFSSEEIKEIKNSLIQISRNAINISASQAQRIAILEQRYESYITQDLDDVSKIKALLNDCKNYGTVAFANLARCAFIAISHLKGLVGQGVLTEDERDKFLNSIQTVAHDCVHEAYLVKTGVLSREYYLKKYGHLRPGTYDIRSESYKNNIEKYMEPIINNANKPESIARFSLHDIPEARKSKIVKFINKLKKGMTLDQFEEFLRYSIGARENYKFIFSKNLSEAIDCIENFCTKNGVSKESASNIHIKDIIEAPQRKNLKEYLEFMSQTHIEENNLAKVVELPAVIFSSEEIEYFHHNKAMPNFITNLTASGEVASISSTCANDIDLEDKIVLTSHADPGFDWVFSYRIKGLITRYGGANSHMAIRCAEFGLPAAIGVGEVMFEKLCPAKVVLLDCNNKLIRKIR